MQLNIARKVDEVLPVAIDISSWSDCREIIYACPKCGQGFRILGREENFCHKCGAKMLWNNAKEKTDQPFTHGLDNYKALQKLLKQINEENRRSLCSSNMCG